MRRASWDGMRRAILGALVAATIVFVFDLMQPDGWLSLNWYLFAAIAGLFIGGPVATSLRVQPYSETMIRQVPSGAGV